MLTPQETSILDDVSLLDHDWEHAAVVSGIMSMFCVFSHLNQNSSTSETIYLFAVSHKSPQLISYTMIHRKHQIKDISASWKQEVIKGHCSADGVDKAMSNFPDKESSFAAQTSRLANASDFTVIQQLEMALNCGE